VGTQITTAEAARRLEVVPLAVRRWVRAGRLDGEKIGDRIVVLASVATLECQDPEAAS
jgi:excisionase family DNA binding protein